MSIKKSIKQNYWGQYLINLYHIVACKTKPKLLSDEKAVKKIYKKRFGKELNLTNPKTFCEKLQWLKLFYRDSIMEICSDKYEIRQYLDSVNMSFLGNEVLGVFDKAVAIDFDSLPEKFVAKATHGSGWNLICTNKSELDVRKAIRLMNTWLKLDLSVFGREWNYKNIKPRIVVEKFLDYTPLYDYKFMCFNGVPKYVQLNNDLNGIHYVDFYEIKSWSHLPISYMGYNKSPRDIEKPKQLSEMIEYSKKISKRFPFVRVDFYNFNDTIILGELTFFPSSGLWPIIPENYKYDEEFGKLLNLPDPNYNLELLERLKKSNDV